MTKRAALLFILVFSLILYAQGQRQGTFHQGDGFGSNATYATAINNLRQVTGWVGSEIGQPQGFIWHDGTYDANFKYTLPPGMLEATQVWGINDFGQTVGSYYNQSIRAGFIRGKYGNTSWLPLAKGLYPLTPRDINNSGVVVGSYYDTSVSKSFGFIRWHKGGMIVLAYPGASSTGAAGVNEHGDVTGSFTRDSDPNAQIGFVYRNGHFRETFQCAWDGVKQSTSPVKINNWGVIVGRCGPYGQQRNFVRDRWGHISYIDTSSINSSTDSGGLLPIVTGLNDYGDVVGYYNPPFTDEVGFRMYSFVLYRAVRSH